ncbi:hypothetical protein DOT_0659 [Desulfosporosinus sp. OT]|nr:hypothetical protein DOT_0659 [Desulfosporosinus sp. OT]
MPRQRFMNIINKSAKLTDKKGSQKNGGRMAATSPLTY